MTSTNPVPGTRGQRWWTAAEQEAYLDSRPVGGLYNPATEYGDPDWREPESDEEAAARTAHLDAAPRDPETAAWVERVAALSAEEKALIDTGIELEHARATHDPDEVADARAYYEAALAAMQAREPGETKPTDELEHREPEHDEEEPEL